MMPDLSSLLNFGDVFSPELGMTMAQHPELIAAKAVEAGIPPPVGYLNGVPPSGVVDPLVSTDPFSPQMVAPPGVPVFGPQRVTPGTEGPPMSTPAQYTEGPPPAASPVSTPQMAPPAPVSTPPVASPTPSDPAAKPQPGAAERLLATLKGIQAPPAPQVQGIRSPQLRQTGNVQASQLIQLLRAMGGGAPEGLKLPNALGQALR